MLPESAAAARQQKQKRDDHAPRPLLTTSGEGLKGELAYK